MHSFGRARTTERLTIIYIKIYPSSRAPSSPNLEPKSQHSRTHTFEHHTDVVHTYVSVSMCVFVCVCVYGCGMTADEDRRGPFDRIEIRADDDDNEANPPHQTYTPRTSLEEMCETQARASVVLVPQRDARQTTQSAHE